MVERLFPDPFLKYQNWAYLWINILKFYVFCFYCLLSWVLLKLIKTKLQTTCIYFKESFQKTKIGLELASLPHFLHDFWRKIILLFYSFTWPNFNVWLPYFVRYWAILCQPHCDVIKFEINLIFLIKSFILKSQEQKVKTKILIPWERKKVLSWNKNIFHHS